MKKQLAVYQKNVERLKREIQAKKDEITSMQSEKDTLLAQLE